MDRGGRAVEDEDEDDEDDEKQNETKTGRRMIKIFILCAVFTLCFSVGPYP